MYTLALSLLLVLSHLQVCTVLQSIRDAKQPDQLRKEINNLSHFSSSAHDFAQACVCICVCVCLSHSLPLSVGVPVAVTLTVCVHVCLSRSFACVHSLTLSLSLYLCTCAYKGFYE